MKRSRLFALTSVLAVLPALGALEASQFPSVATASTSCEVDQATKLKDLDSLRSEILFQTPGFDQRLMAIVNLFPAPPGEFGVNKVKGKAFLDWFCFDGVSQKNRGRDKDKFDREGHAAATQRILANANCLFSGVTSSFNGSKKQPAGAPIELLFGAQAVAPGADPDCFDEGTMCLTNDNRFKVEVTWSDFSSQSGSGVAFPRSDDSGTFFFFDPDNTELLLKVIDGCRFNDHYWVFYAATTDVGFELTVTDTQTNQSRVYDNPLGQPAPAITDTQAFATCP